MKNILTKSAILPVLTLLAAPCCAWADSPPPVSLGIWTLQDENASITAFGQSDRYYVNGLNVAWTSPEGDVPGALADLGHAIWGDGTQRISIGIMQQIYTPAATSLVNPPLNQEPYAGYLAANVDLIQDTDTTRSVLGIYAGLIGPDAGAELIQNGFHSFIGQPSTRGWKYQLPNEPAVDIFAARIWRLPVAQFSDGLQMDALPQISAMAGLTQDYVEPAIGLRLGQGLDSDFGPSLLAPSSSGTDAYQASQPFVWYLFASAGAKIVGHDEFLQGTDFTPSRNVDPYRVVGNFEAGITFIVHDIRFSYTQVFQTNRYYGQPGIFHEFGSFSASFVF